MKPPAHMSLGEIAVRDSARAGRTAETWDRKVAPLGAVVMLDDLIGLPVPNDSITRGGGRSLLTNW